MTLRKNRSTFERLWLGPHVQVDVRPIEKCTLLLGVVQVPLPIATTLADDARGSVRDR